MTYRNDDPCEKCRKEGRNGTLRLNTEGRYQCQHRLCLAGAFEPEQTVKERQERMREQFRKTGTYPVEDVHAILGDPTRGITLTAK